MMLARWHSGKTDRCCELWCRFAQKAGQMSRQVYKSPVTHPGWKNPGSVAEIFHRTRIAFGKVGSFGSYWLFGQIILYKTRDPAKEEPIELELCWPWWCRSGLCRSWWCRSWWWLLIMISIMIMILTMLMELCWPWWWSWLAPHQRLFISSRRAWPSYHG